MTAALEALHVTSRRQWRAWLTKHHTSSPAVWLVFYEAHTGAKSIPYEDMVREALCFGRDFVVWIHMAKRPETRARRTRESIVLLAAGKKLGLK